SNWLCRARDRPFVRIARRSSRCVGWASTRRVESRPTGKDDAGITNSLTSGPDGKIWFAASDKSDPGLARVSTTKRSAYIHGNHVSHGHRPNDATSTHWHLDSPGRYP